MRVILGKNKCLGNFGPAGKYLCKQFITEGTDYRPYLVGGYHTAVELLRSILQVVIQTLPAAFTGHFITFIDVEAGIHFAALFCYFSFNTIYFITHIYAICNSTLVVIFHHQILIKKAECLLGRCCGQSDNESIEIFEYLSP